VLAHRFTRERLLSLTRTRDGTVDIVFVSLSGGGRGQIAAALTRLLGGDNVSVHAAGTSAPAVIDPSVATVIGELGVDISEAFARPVTTEVIASADVVVTMGLSVGVVDTVGDVRREDWRVGDPMGASVAEARRVRDDIERRVRALLEDLGALDEAT
jgi:arsenate reductase (thioredoxin)